MTLGCPSCEAQYNLDESRIPAAGMQLRCPKCGTNFHVTRQGASALAPGEEKQVELPGGGPGGTNSSEPVPAGNVVPLPAPADAPPVRTTSAPGAATSGGAGPVPLPSAGGAPPAPPPLPKRSSTTVAAAEGRVPLPASAAMPPVSPAESQLDIDELFGADPMPTPRVKPVIEIQHPKTATAELPMVASDLELPSLGSAARTIDAPQSLDLGTDLGVAVPVMGQSAPQRKNSSPGVPSPPPRVAPAIPPPKAPPAIKRSDSMEGVAVNPPPSPVSSPGVIAGPPPPRAAPTLGRGKRRYQIRRVSGKVFGPFDEERVTRMLIDGELAGTESVKAEDGEWEPIGDIPVFAAVVPKAAPVAQPAAPAAGASEQPPAPMDPVEQAQKLQQVYGERMAAMTIVERIPMRDRIRKILPQLIAAAATVVVLAIGLLLGLTHQGLFARFLILGAPQTSARSPAGALVAQARTDLRVGTFGSLKAGFAAAERAHVLEPMAVDAEALMGELAGALSQESAGEAVGELVRAKGALVAAVDYGPRNQEVLRARAAMKLSEGPKAEPQARADLEALVAKQVPPQAETLNLLGSAYRDDEKDKAKAKQAFQKAIAIDPKMGKSYLALAELARAAGDTTEALAQAQKALAAEPGQAGAKLMVVDLSFKAGQALAMDDLDALIDDKSGLSKAERATALALRAEGRMKANHPEDAAQDLAKALQINAGNREAVVADARLLLSQHRAIEALKVLQTAPASLAAKDLEVAEVLAQAQIDEGHYPEASQTVATALIAHPDNATLVMLKGVAAASSGKAEEAEKVLLEALKSDPTLSEAQLALGKLYLGLNQMDKARAAFEAAVRTEPQSSRVHAGLAQFLTAAGDAEGARKELSTTVSLDPRNAEGHLIFGNVLRKLGQGDQALVELRKAETLDPKLPRIQLVVGELLESRGAYGEASAEYRAAVEMEPKNPEPPRLLGRNLREAGDIEGSLEALQQSVNLDAQNSQIHAELALTFLKKAENSRALLEAKTSVEIDPKNPDAWRAEGRVEIALASNKEALDCFDKSVTLQPSSAESQQLRGQTLAAMSRLSPAIDAYQKALQLDPSRTPVLLEVGQLQVRAKSYAEAVKTYQKALDAKPPLPEAYYLIARALDEEGKAKDAAKYYELATKADPNNPLPYKYLGYYYKGASQAAKAKAAFQAYLKKKPDAEDKEVVAEEISFLKR
jgi:cellulose synthase operon protein C